MPALTGVKEGEKVDLTIKMYFGEVELKVEGKCFIYSYTLSLVNFLFIYLAVIRGKTYGTTCTFDTD